MKFEELKKGIIELIKKCENINELIVQLEGSKFGILITNVNFKELAIIQHLNAQE